MWITLQLGPTIPIMHHGTIFCSPLRCYAPWRVFRTEICPRESSQSDSPGESHHPDLPLEDVFSSFLGCVTVDCISLGKTSKFMTSQCVLGNFEVSTILAPHHLFDLKSGTGKDFLGIKQNKMSKCILNQWQTPKHWCYCIRGNYVLVLCSDISSSKKHWSPIL